MDQNSGFHGNRNRPLTYNGENYVSTFSLLFLSDLFRLAGNEDRHEISDDFEFLPDRTTPYRVRCIMGKWCLQASSIIFNWIFVKLAGNHDRHKISDEFEFRPDRINHFGVMCP